VPIVPVYAERQASGLKTAVAPLLKILPKSVKLMLRKMEVNSGVHNKIKERQISFPNDAVVEQVRKAKKIVNDARRLWLFDRASLQDRESNR
jgi:hypothetical protein